MREALAVGLAGATGALLRHGLVVLGARWDLGAFPWVILLINAVGSLALGALVGAHAAGAVSTELRVAVGAGLLGGFTTFSTFSVDTVRLAERAPAWAVANVVASVGLGLLAAAVGLRWGRG
jgi:CrcB protein